MLQLVVVGGFVTDRTAAGAVMQERMRSESGGRMRVMKRSRRGEEVEELMT